MSRCYRLFCRTLDHLGSTRVVTFVTFVTDEAGADEAGADEAGADEAGADEAGADVSRLGYTPFGELIPSSLGSRVGLTTLQNVDRPSSRRQLPRDPRKTDGCPDLAR